MFYPQNDSFEFDLSDDKSYMNPPEKEDDFNVDMAGFDGVEAIERA